MGTWGPAIPSNDVYQDVKHEFFKLYNDGEELTTVKAILVDNNQAIIESYEDSNNFWLALADCLWHCKALDKETKEKVISIIDSNQDIVLWEELGSTKADLKKRQKALSKFIDKISIEKLKPRKRKKKVLIDAIFSKGDCLVFKVKSGRYGGAVVLESETQTEHGLNLLALTAIDMVNIPKLADIKSSYVLMDMLQVIPGEVFEKELISWFYAETFKNCSIEIIKVGCLNIKNNYDSHQNRHTFSADWNYLSKYLNHQANKAALHGQPKKKVKVKSLLKRKWF